MRTPPCKVGHRGMRKESAILHWVCSTYELRLIARCYEVANARDDGGVMRHMHDGCDVRGTDDYVAAMQAAVATEAGYSGPRTRLVEKRAP